MTGAPLGRSYNQLGDLRAREQPEGNKGGAEAGGDVELRRAVRVDALDVARAQMREPEPASGIGKDDLTRVVVPREDQVEPCGDTPRTIPGKWSGSTGDPRPSRPARREPPSARAYDCASTPTIWMRRPRSSTSTDSSPRSVTFSSAPIAAGSTRWRMGRDCQRSRGCRARHTRAEGRRTSARLCIPIAATRDRP